MATKTPADVARELNLKFSEEPMGSDGKWVRFRFEFPDDNAPVDTKTVTLSKPPAGYVAPKGYLDAVRGVTEWRRRCGPWLFVGTTDTVAAKLTVGTRIAVGLWNRKNRKVLKAAAKQLETSEAYARQLATSQPTPMQGVRILDDLTKLAEPETQMLRKQLVEAAQQAEVAIAAARAHADGKCGCGVGDLCPVGVSERDAAADKALAEVIPLRKAVG